MRNSRVELAELLSGVLRCSGMKLRILAFVIAVAGGNAAAQDLPAVLYHAQDNTVGCANPLMTWALTDPQEPRRRNPTWVRQSMSEGRCVSITTQSPWKLAALDGDMALMIYAGSVGPPGAYYLRVSEMIDSAGRHPDSIPTAPAVVKGPAAKSSEVNSASATALAPDPDNASLPSSPPADRNGVLWVAVIAALAVAAIAAVIASQRLNLPRNRAKP
jgi:hypothetical protein